MQWLALQRIKSLQISSLADDIQNIRSYFGVYCHKILNLLKSQHNIQDIGLTECLVLSEERARHETLGKLHNRSAMEVVYWYWQIVNLRRTTSRSSRGKTWNSLWPKAIQWETYLSSIVWCSSHCIVAPINLCNEEGSTATSRGNPC